MPAERPPARPSAAPATAPGAGRLPRAQRAAEERRRNLIALAIGLGIVVVAIAFCARPAFVLGVGPGALANSIEGEAEIRPTVSGPPADDRTASCERVGEDLFECRLVLTYVSDGDPLRATYRVEAASSGCWEARRTAGSDDLLPGLSGCVWILNY